MVRKQISYYLSIEDWKLCRAEAARQGIPLAEFCRRLLQPQIELLKRRSATARPA